MISWNCFSHFIKLHRSQFISYCSAVIAQAGLWFISYKTDEFVENQFSTNSTDYFFRKNLRDIYRYFDHWRISEIPSGAIIHKCSLVINPSPIFIGSGSLTLNSDQYVFLILSTMRNTVVCVIPSFVNPALWNN